jgi:transcriptional antiterminator RfaH
MGGKMMIDVPRWYAIRTKLREEDRVDSNLRAWQVETLSPKTKTIIRNQFTGKPRVIVKPLFTGYIFARFDADKLLHKVYYTRGVHSIVSFGASPHPIEDEVIALIQSRIGEDGFVHFNDDLKPGDEVTIKDGSFKGLHGVFDRKINDSDRVRIFLTSLNYQASISIVGGLVQKTNPAVYSNHV